MVRVIKGISPIFFLHLETLFSTCLSLFLIYLLIPYPTPIILYLMPNKQVPLHLYPHGLYYWVEKSIEERTVFCQLSTSDNILVTIISSTIPGLLFCHFFSVNSINNRNWLLNYYSDRTSILLFF